MKKHLVIGNGQIGTAISKVLNCEAIGKGESIDDTYEFIHICIPFSKEFVDIVKEYQAKYKPEVTVIHSTVAIGTSEELNACHSPVRGKHPDLEGGVRTFIKFFGGKGAERAAQAFKDKAVQVFVAPNSRSVEAMKLWDTTQYGVDILMMRLIHDFCEKHDLDFDTVYTYANKSYNDGYEKLGHPEFKKYILKFIEGSVGGHCVSSNAVILLNMLWEENGDTRTTGILKDILSLGSVYNGPDDIVYQFCEVVGKGKGTRQVAEEMQIDEEEIRRNVFGS